MSEYEVPEMLDSGERVGGLQLEGKPETQEMDILKDLPSFNSENFSKFGSNGCSGRTGSHLVKRYVKLKRHSVDEVTPQVIVMESESLILKELEVLIAKQEAAARVSLKRSSSCRVEHDSDSSSSKVPRTDDTDIDSVSSWSFDYS